jgi:hypothetical protein
LDAIVVKDVVLKLDCAVEPDKTIISPGYLVAICRSK